MAGGNGERGFMVECYWPGVSERTLQNAARRTEAATADLRASGRKIDYLGSVFVPTDETVFWFFDGPEDDVRAVSERAGLPFERILESLRLDGGSER